MSLPSRKTAMAEGRRWRSLLKNPRGWRIMLHKNGRSNFDVYLYKRGMSLYNSGGFLDFDRSKDADEFRVLFNENGWHGCGSGFWNVGRKGYKDPNKAIEGQLKISERFVRRCKRAIAGVRRCKRAIAGVRRCKRAIAGVRK